jgi:phosphatidylethanolamine/phosphatidyl-N-methylethanolamine N-methyltransferase
MAPSSYPHATSADAIDPSLAARNALVDRVYRRLAPVYDLVFGRPLHRGRVAAVARMDLRPGARVLEVGVGTGICLGLYPSDCQVTGVDLSTEMLERARARVRRERLHHVRLREMDAASLAFDSAAFDVVYAPYVMTVVPDPVQVAREMRRVCRPDGRILFLNHFSSERPLVARIERLVSPVTRHVGFRTDLELDALLTAARLTPLAIVKVSVPPVSLVVCTK